MTLAEFHALDPLALWRALPPERQAGMIVPLLTSAFSEFVMDDDGTDASWHDREAAATIYHDNFNEAWKAIEATFPEILAEDLTALWTLYGDDLAAAIDDAETVEVHSQPGRHSVLKIEGAVLDHYRQVSLAGRLHDFSGWHDVASSGDLPRWVAWTDDQIDAERLRRHPEHNSPEHKEEHRHAA